MCQSSAGDRVGDLVPGRSAPIIRRDENVPLATWAAGEVIWFSKATEKMAAAEELYAQAAHPSDVFPVDWKAESGGHLLMLEHHC